ncbi:potassium voltage-gated channel subfamily H member 7 [Trichonephila clavipes]|nr:potassium voltage-gated channel subfamily H member 7 [Trichonephila clavipes]
MNLRSVVYSKSHVSVFKATASSSTGSHVSRKMAFLVSPIDGPSGSTSHTLLDDDEAGADGDVDEDDDVDKADGTPSSKLRSRQSKSSQGRMTTTSSAPQTTTSGHKSTSSSMTIPLSCSSSTAHTPGDELSPDQPICDRTCDELSKLDVRVEDLSK